MWAHLYLSKHKDAPSRANKPRALEEDKSHIQVESPDSAVVQQKISVQIIYTTGISPRPAYIDVGLSPSLTSYTDSLRQCISLAAQRKGGGS